MVLNLPLLSKNVRLGVFISRIQGISKQTAKPDPKKVSCDYIGPVDPVSNLRQHVRHISVTETSTQRRLREMRNSVDESNQQFWKSHNESFYKERQAFIKQQKISHGDDEVSADKMSEFYKKFLDENHKRHVIYNLDWYKQNFKVLMLAFQVELESLFKKLTSKK